MPGLLPRPRCEAHTIRTSLGGRRARARAASATGPPESGSAPWPSPRPRPPPRRPLSRDDHRMSPGLSRATARLTASGCPADSCTTPAADGRALPRSAACKPEFWQVNEGARELKAAGLLIRWSKPAEHSAASGVGHLGQLSAVVDQIMTAAPLAAPLGQHGSSTRSGIDGNQPGTTGIVPSRLARPGRPSDRPERPRRRPTDSR